MIFPQDWAMLLIFRDQFLCHTVFLSANFITNVTPSTEGEDVPEPDYHEAELANGSSAHRPSDGSGLVGPKKLPNPVLDSKERQNLHRELLMNQKL